MSWWCRGSHHSGSQGYYYTLGAVACVASGPHPAQVSPAGVAHEAALLNCSNQQFGLWQRQVKAKIPDVVRQAELLAVAEQYREKQAAGSVLQDVPQHDTLGAPLNLLRRTAAVCMQGPRTVLVRPPTP